MIRYLTGDSLSHHPQLAETMFRDRTTQFRDRLGWPVNVDAAGGERDQYDALNPLYVIWQRPDGRHGGSLRFLPTTGRTMLAEHFAHLVPGGLADPDIWECTRFCIAPGAGRQVAAAVMLGGLEAGLRLGLGHSAGVFDGCMMRVYRALGWVPEILGRSGTGRDAICAGLWRFDPALREGLARRAGLDPAAAAGWAAELGVARRAA